MAAVAPPSAAGVEGTGARRVIIKLDTASGHPLLLWLGQDLPQDAGNHGLRLQMPYDAVATDCDGQNEAHSRGR